MVMRFRGGGVGHVSTRSATDTFKTDRDDLDIESQQSRKNQPISEDDGLNGDELCEEGLERDIEVGEGEVDEEEWLSDSEVVDYGYELESDSDEEGEEDMEVHEEDETAVNELGCEDY
jgi:hypothetical protein